MRLLRSVYHDSRLLLSGKVGFSSRPYRCASSSSSVDAKRDNGCKNNRQPDFHNAKVIYAEKSFTELLRSYLVFSLCSVDTFVDHQTKILAWMRRLLGRRVFVALMKKTVFGQFMASEDPEAVLGLARRHSLAGVSPLFAYTAAEFHGGHSESSSGSVSKAREIWCRQNFDAVANSIEIANKCKGFTRDQPVVTTKVTFLTDYSVLRSLTEIVNQQTRLIEACVSDGGQACRRTLYDYLSEATNETINDSGDLGQLVPCIEADGQGPSRHQLSRLLTSASFHIYLNRFVQRRPAPVVLLGNWTSINRLRDDDIQRILKLWLRMSELNKMASEQNVIVNYDAEQTFIQPAIEVLVLDSMRRFNGKQPSVLNTYQCYLKRTLGILKRDLELSRQEGFCFGGKVVRGAYMDEERRLARQNNYPDPVNDTYDITTEVYSKAIESILADAVKLEDSHTKPMRTIVATHNLDTVNFVINRLANKGLDARNAGISFAQLLGTRDYITFALGAAGYPAGKLIHYAEPENGLAYLSRRLQENRSGLPSPAIERRLLMNELRRRFLRRP